MADLITIRMTLTGPFKGKTKLLNHHQFIDGVTTFTGNAIQVEGVTKYFTRSYQIEVAEVKENEIEAEAEEDNEGVRIDDSDVLSDEDVEEADEDESDPEQPNTRQQAIIAAVNGIEREEWVDKNGTPHPKVKDVEVLMEDPTVTKAEIIEVIEKWLS